MNIFDHSQPEIIEVTFSFPEFATAYKNSLLQLFPLKIQSILESVTRVPIFDQAFEKTFKSTFNFQEFVSTCKSGYFIIVSRDIADLKILQSDWLGVFQPMSQKPGFYQTWDLYRIIVNKIKFHFWANAEKKY